MARKLKTYQTSLGFYDLAIAAPSMKAALQAWGAESNLFHQGFAHESDDPEVTKATMAAPGVVLKRPVGSKGAFRDNAELPKNLADGGSKKAERASPKSKPQKRAPPTRDQKIDRTAALAFEKEQQRRDREQAKEEAARQRERERRKVAIDKVQSALDSARSNHEEHAARILAELETLEERLRDEEARWHKERVRLEVALRRARGGN